MPTGCPASATEFRRIPGVGGQKLKDFAEAFMAEIAARLADHPRLSFDESSVSTESPREGPTQGRSARQWTEPEEKDPKFRRQWPSSRLFGD